MHPALILMRHVPMAALVAGAVVVASVALALPLLAAFAPPEPDPADATPDEALPAS